MDDVNIKGNNRWKYQDISCISCKDKNTIETQRHLLYCVKLLGKNKLLTYMPSYEDLFEDDYSEQVYISNIIRENFMIRDDTFNC